MAKDWKPLSIAIIPARGGSTRIPGKNKREFRGRPIIEYSIQEAQESGQFDQIIVSSDDPDILAIAERAGAFPSRRATWLCDNDVGTQQVTSQVIEQHRRDFGFPQYVCCIYATCPLIYRADLARGADQIRQRRDLDYAMAVGIDPLCDAGQFYWGEARAFTEGRPLLGPWTAMVAIDPRRVCDINTPADWERAERMFDSLRRVNLV